MAAEKQGWNKWLVGCGAGCGCLVLGVVIVIGSMAFWVRGMTSNFDAAVESREAIEEQFGEASSYVPSHDGAVDAGRMEAFLNVREATVLYCQTIAKFFDAIPDTDAEIDAMEDAGTADQLAFAFRMMGGGLRMPTAMANLFRARNEALLAQQMSLGEYSYIYVIAYRAYLDQYPVSEQPSAGDETGQTGLDISDLTEMGVYRRRVHGELLEMLRAQSASVPADAPPGWRDELDAEIERMAENPRAIPWEAGLPPAIRAGFERFRDRLQATYVPACTEFDLGRSTKKGSASYTME